MQLHLKAPLAIFDLETTGVNVSSDRILEIAIIKMLPGGGEEKLDMRLNPEMPIPEESSMIHGIYDKDVENQPTFADVARDVIKFLDKCDLGGFNMLKFDVPVLLAEIERSGLEFSLQGRKFVDAQKIFFMMEKRTLSAAYEFYCGKSLVDAHSAYADTKATMEVILSQMSKYDGKTVTDSLGNTIGAIEHSVESMHTISAHKMVDLAGRMIMNNDGVEVFNFGKFKNRPVEEVLKKEAGIYDWIMKGDFPLDTKNKLTEIKLRGFGRR
jgi:DNA polymerase-3 subunit epsilon